MILNKMSSRLIIGASCLITGLGAANADGLVHNTSTASTTQETEKKFNVEWNILPTVLGYASGGVDYRVNEASAIGVNAGINTRNSDDVTLYNVGVTYSYALNGDYMSSGWVFKPFVNYAYFKDKTAPTETTQGTSIGMLFTYKWLWESGINVQAGFGPQYASVNSGGWSDDDGTKGMLLAGEFGLGYSF